MVEGDWNRALDDINLALDEFPDDTVLYKQKGIATYEVYGDYDKAINYLK